MTPRPPLRCGEACGDRAVLRGRLLAPRLSGWSQRPALGGVRRAGRGGMPRLRECKTPGGTRLCPGAQSFVRVAGVPEVHFTLCLQARAAAGTRAARARARGRGGGAQCRCAPLRCWRKDAPLLHGRHRGARQSGRGRGRVSGRIRRTCAARAAEFLEACHRGGLVRAAAVRTRVTPLRGGLRVRACARAGGGACGG